MSSHRTHRRYHLRLRHFRRPDWQSITNGLARVSNEETIVNHHGVIPRLAFNRVDLP